MEPANQVLASLTEKYPHVAEKLRIFWGQPEFPKVLQSYTMDTRDNTRKGFPFDVMVLLINIGNMHDTMFPQFRLSNNDFTTFDRETSRSK